MHDESQSASRSQPSIAALFGEVAEATDPAQLARAMAAARHRLLGAPPPPPLQVGRYEIDGRIGAGGMGVVYAGFDPQLRRAVAVKLVRGGGADGRGQQRLLLEGQTLARLNHPNIVTLFDVGVHEDAVFLAMELVEGQTLDAWLRAAPRSTAQILKTLLAAGRGLAAAHRAGVVHRDFKPGNLLVGHDGRVRVADFGIAHTADESRASTPAESEGAGTPGYMAPEQREGGVVTGAADQFAFCVTAWEALHGARPGASPRSRARLPFGVRAALRRGMQADPARRWPTMEALLVRIERGLRGRRGIVGAAALLGVLAVGVVIAAPWRAAVPAACAVAAQLTGVWDLATRERVGVALRAAGDSEATRTIAVLDRRVGAWAAAFTRTCSATLAAGVASAGPLQGRLRCLEDQRRALAASVAVLARGDPRMAGRVQSLALALAGPEACDDPRRLAAASQREAAPGSAELRGRMAAIEAEARTGEVDAALAASEALVADEVAPGDAALRLAAELQRGEILAYLRRDDAARVQLEAVYLAAHGEGLTDLAVRAAIALVPVVARLDPRPDGALAWWQRLVRVEATRDGDPRRLRDAEAALGQAALARGDWVAVEVAFSAALAAQRMSGPEEVREEVGYHNFRGLSLERRGRHEEALAEFSHALALGQRLLGPDHPIVGTTFDNIGGVLQQRGELAAALQALQRGLAIRVAAGPPEDPEIAGSLHNIAVVHVLAGRPALAVPLLRRGLAIEAQALGPRSPVVAHTMASLGYTLLDLDLAGEAESLLARAIAAQIEARGREHPELAVFHLQHAQALRALGRDAEARVACDLAEEMLARLAEPDPAVVIGARQTRGAIALDRGDVVMALDALEAARKATERMVGGESPEHAARLVDLGHAALAASQFERAEALFARAEAHVDAGSRGAWRAGLAELHLRRGQLARAHAAAQEALAEPLERTSRGELQLVLAEVAARAGRREEAIALARAAQRELPRMTAAHRRRVAAIEAVLRGEL